MKAFLAALLTTIVIFVLAHLVGGVLAPGFSTATAHSVPGAVRLDAQELPPADGRLVARPPAVIPPLVPRRTVSPPASVRLDPAELPVRGPRPARE